MWTFIIIIAAIILIAFIFDTNKQSSEISRQGGIRNKYSVLIDTLLHAHDHSRIFQENNTFVAVGVMNSVSLQIYYIYPSYGYVSIRMELKNNPLFGNMKMEWKFPENMNQTDMIKKMEGDFEDKVLNFINQQK